MIKKILVISVHPDDEVLGCGGTLLKHKSNDDRLYWLILTMPTLNHPYGFSIKDIKRRKNEIEEISGIFGFEKTFNLDFPTQLLDEINMRELIKKIDNCLQKIKPDIVYAINRSDIHSDHRIAFQAICSCTKNFRNEYIDRILMYETLSETEFAPALRENAFIPNVFVDISDFMEKKIQAMKIYKSELMEKNLPRSINAIKALASYRGSRIGVKYAEAFMLLFEKI